MPITTDLTTTTGQIRLLIGDAVESNGVKPDGSNFTDSEIAFFYEREGSIERAASLACETLAHLWNVQPDFEADGLRVNRQQIAAGWWGAALRWRGAAGARSISLIRQDAYSDNIAANTADPQNGEGMP